MCDGNAPLSYMTASSRCPATSRPLGRPPPRTGPASRAPVLLGRPQRAFSSFSDAPGARPSRSLCGRASSIPEPSSKIRPAGAGDGRGRAGGDGETSGRYVLVCLERSRGTLYRNCSLEGPSLEITLSRALSRDRLSRLLSRGTLSRDRSLEGPSLKIALSRDELWLSRSLRRGALALEAALSRSVSRGTLSRCWSNRPLGEIVRCLSSTGRRDADDDGRGGGEVRHVECHILALVAGAQGNF